MDKLETDRNASSDLEIEGLCFKVDKILEQNGILFDMLASIAAINQEQNILIARLIQISDAGLNNLIVREEYKKICSKLDSIGRIGGKLLEELCVIQCDSRNF